MPSQAPAGTAASITTLPTAAPAAAASTPACPDKLVWNGKWDTRWVNEDDDVMENVWVMTGKDDPLGPNPVPVTLSQNCWDVTGTYKTAPGTSPGKITAKIEGNQLKGAYAWNEGATDSEWGTFHLTMAANNQSWVGQSRDNATTFNYVNMNWYGKKSS